MAPGMPGTLWVAGVCPLADFPPNQGLEGRHGRRRIKVKCLPEPLGENFQVLFRHVRKSGKALEEAFGGEARPPSGVLVAEPARQAARRMQLIFHGCRSLGMHGQLHKPIP